MDTKFYVRRSLCTLFSFFCIVTLVMAGGPETKDADLKIRKVSLFKNGLGFVTSTAVLPAGQKNIRFGQLPVPSFGTFWVGYGKDIRVKQLVSFLETTTREVSVQNLVQLLQVNAGREVTLHMGYDPEKMLEGIIMKSSDIIPADEVPSPYFMDIRPDLRNSSVQTPSNLLLLKTTKGTVALNAGSVIRADFKDHDLIHYTVRKQTHPSVRMELDRPAGGRNVTVSYLARGVTWAPSYLIDLSDERKARFSARGLIVNELVNLENVQIDLITGFPNIKFSDIASPVAMSQKLSDFLNALAGGGPGPYRESQHMLAQQAVLLNRAAYDDFEGTIPDYSTAAEGMTAEDLFLYPVTNFTLKKGENAWIPLFTLELPYRHIYTWKIKDVLDSESGYRSGRENTDGKMAEEVWHSCRLTNKSKMPLTTAAAEFVKHGEFTGQDICYFTAPGAETTIRMNRAMNVLAEQSEIEIERNRNAARFHGYQYDLVKMKGELKLRSRLTGSVTIEITKELSGDVLRSFPVAEDVKTAKGLKQVNPKHVLTWEITLKPGEEISLIYHYQIYIRS